MKLQKTTILLLFMIFISVVAGVLIVQTSYAKKIPQNYNVLGTMQSVKYGEISMERYYRNGNNVKAFGFYQDGKMKSEYYLTDNSGYSSKYVSYYPNRQIEAKYLRWIERGTKQYLDEEYFEDGRLRRREGTKVNRWEYYDDNGDPTVIYQRNGDSIKEISYYSGWKKQEEAEFINDIRNGSWIQWDSSGKEIRNEVYTNGVKIK
jgi:antitoxin component YwqK of YwqJK toxin-antitoxin module